jgi:hypothetical protein
MAILDWLHRLAEEERGEEGQHGGWITGDEERREVKSGGHVGLEKNISAVMGV